MESQSKLLLKMEDVELIHKGFGDKRFELKILMQGSRDGF
jgi:hypothetical protein